MEFTINLSGKPFNLEYTIGSGQVFRWQKKGEDWEGVVSRSFVKIRQEGELLFCRVEGVEIDSAFLVRYFRLDEDLGFILGKIAKDEVMRRAVRSFYGLRLIRQEPWECLASFLLSTNANIPRISRMIDALCRKYGEPLKAGIETYYSFPKAEVLSNTTERELRELGLGYRSRYLLSVSRSVASHKVDFERLSKLSYEEARKEILAEFEDEKILSGVGNKVADCFLLFSLGKDEAFPIDTWILKALKEYYPNMCRDIGSKTKLSNRDYLSLSRNMRSYFGEYAGYAQQYLYSLSRSEL